MTKQKIIDLLYNEIGNPDYKTVGDYHKGIADKLLALVEQEKKEQATKIFNRVFSDDTAGDLGEFCGYGWVYDIDEAKAIAKEYGVEL